MHWVRGDASSLAREGTDLIVLTGNVAQHIVGTAWPAALRDVSAALKPGGRLVFESRNPAARAWQDWAATGRTTRETTLGTVTEWMDVEPMTRDGHVSFLTHNVLSWSGETIVARQTLAFRSEHRIRFDLADVGLQVEAVWGGWNNEPVEAHSRVMVFQAQRPNLEASA